MTVGQLTDSTRNRLLHLYGKRETDAIIRVIWEYLRDWQPVDLVLRRDEEAGPAVESDFEQMVERLKKSEPLQYILGEARFFGLRLKVNPSTLIPRPETEGLVQLILDGYAGIPDLKLLDVGAGSGAIALALARHLPFADATALDVSGEALSVVDENAKNLHVAVTSVQADIFQWKFPPESFNIVVSNPPYITPEEEKQMDRNVLDYEPRRALFAPESDPIAFYRTIAGGALAGLMPGGRLYFELNPLTASDVKAMTERTGYRDVQILKDIHGRTRYLKAEKD